MDSLFSIMQADAKRIGNDHDEFMSFVKSRVTLAYPDSISFAPKAPFPRRPFVSFVPLLESDAKYVRAWKWVPAEGVASPHYRFAMHALLFPVPSQYASFTYRMALIETAYRAYFEETASQPPWRQDTGFFVGERFQVRRLQAAMLKNVGMKEYPRYKKTFDSCVTVMKPQIAKKLAEGTLIMLSRSVLVPACKALGPDLGIYDQEYRMSAVWYAAYFQIIEDLYPDPEQSAQKKLAFVYNCNAVTAEDRMWHMNEK